MLLIKAIDLQHVRLVLDVAVAKSDLFGKRFLRQYVHRFQMRMECIDHSQWHIQ